MGATSKLHSLSAIGFIPLFSPTNLSILSLYTTLLAHHFMWGTAIFQVPPDKDFAIGIGLRGALRLWELGPWSNTVHIPVQPKIIPTPLVYFKPCYL